jgi:hypothetical protein
MSDFVARKVLLQVARELMIRHEILNVPRQQDDLVGDIELQPMSGRSDHRHSV